MTSSFRMNCSLNCSSGKEHNQVRLLQDPGVVKQALSLSRFSVSGDNQKRGGQKKSPALEQAKQSQFAVFLISPYWFNATSTIIVYCAT